MSTTPIPRDPQYFLCSYRPLCGTALGRRAISVHNLPPFIDGSCRREPDFLAAAPSISALCRAGQFAPRLIIGDRIAYITRQGVYGGGYGGSTQHIVALLTVEYRFESHADAAAWYRARQLPLPSNCLVQGNPPEPFDRTNGILPKVVARNVNPKVDPARAVVRWDLTYVATMRAHGVFLVCHADFLELQHPPRLSRAEHIAIFGRFRNTQGAPHITPQEYEALRQFANAHRTLGNTGAL